MTNACSRCRRSTPTFDDHDLCPQCRIAAGVCNVDVSNPCLTCLRWNTRTWHKLRKSHLGGRKAEGSSEGEATLVVCQLAEPPAMQPAAPTAAQLAAPTAMPLLPIMSVRPNQMGYFAGAPSNFYS